MQINQLTTIQDTTKAYWLIVRNDELFLENEAPFVPLSLANEIMVSGKFSKAIYLGEHAGYPVYMLRASQVAIAKHYAAQFASLTDLITEFDFDLFGFAAKAVQFQLFLDTHKFCGRCGQRMKHVGWEMAMHCRQCHHRCYPRLSPCVIMGVLKENKLLLAQGKRSKSGHFSVLAGFVEPGETLEQAVAREVFEETAIKVKNVRYFSSQAWPFPHQLMVGFIADYAAGEIRVDEKEILQAHWYNLSELPDTPGQYSIAGQIIGHIVESYQ